MTGDLRAPVFRTAVLAMTVAACAPSPSPAPAISPSSTGTSVGPASTSPASVSPASVSPAPSGAAVDPSLLDVLPSSIAGLDFIYQPDASAQAAADLSPGQGTLSIAYAVAGDPDGGDLVVAAVTRPSPRAFGDDFFRSWRDTFDESACEPAGGISGHAEAQIGGRTVFIGTCEAGLTIYHAYLARRALVVSVTSFGAGRLGEQLMGALRD